MLKSILSVVAVVFLLVACNKQSDESKDKMEMTTVTVLNFQQEAPKLVGKHVHIEGTVLHTCKHGGKRMFLIDKNDSVRVEITAGPEITKFDESLIGTTVLVMGSVKEERIDEKYLTEWENELKADAKKDENSKEIHTGAKGHEDQTADDKMEQINDYRKTMKETGKDHLSFYSIEATSFSEKKK